jgi:hypothetical protein
MATETSGTMHHPRDGMVFVGNWPAKNDTVEAPSQAGLPASASVMPEGPGPFVSHRRFALEHGRRHRRLAAAEEPRISSLRFIVGPHVVAENVHVAGVTDGAAALTPAREDLAGRAWPVDRIIVTPAQTGPDAVTVAVGAEAVVDMFGSSTDPRAATLRRLWELAAQGAAGNDAEPPVLEISADAGSFIDQQAAAGGSTAA